MTVTTTTNIALTKKCNGNCPFCIDCHKPEYNQKDSLTVEQIVSQPLSKRVLLLGGEPLLYPDLGKLINCLHKSKELV